MIVLFKKLTREEAEDTIRRIEQWFRDNSTRKLCHTDLFDVRRDHIREDILKHSQR